MNTATTNTAYLVGLNARVLKCTAVHDPNGQTTDLVGRDSRNFWERELMIRARAAINLLGLPGGFAITFDHRPSTNAHPDLAIVAACALAAGHDLHTPEHTLYLGELSLTGRVNNTRGVFPILESVEGFDRAFVPQGNAIEAGANTNRIMCTTVTNVHDLIDIGSLSRGFAPSTWDAWESRTLPIVPRGLSDGSVADLKAAVDSGRNVLIVGQRAWGAAQTFHEIYNSMSRLSGSEARAIASIHSAVGILTDGKMPTSRPFRAPHHTIDSRALVGGAYPTRPGEVTLAQHGTLVLDHVLDFKRSGLEALANVVRNKHVTIVQREENVDYPVDCRIVATVYPDEQRFFTAERVAFLGDYVRVEV